jgi:N-acetylglucosamine-6-sulfatase
MMLVGSIARGLVGGAGGSAGMRVRTWGALVVAVILATGCSSLNATTKTPSHPSKPNVLFVFTDDLDMQEIAYMPNLRSMLIDHGVSFSHYFVSVSLCCPSRTTTLRGQYSHNTGVETNAAGNGGFETARRLGVEKSTIATWLSRGGYRTALIGKYLNGYPNSVSDTYVPPGWDVFDSAVQGDPYNEFDYSLNETGKVVHYGKAADDYGTDVYVKKTQDFMTESAVAGRPFFAYLAVYAPHQPATPAPRDAAKFDGVRAPRTPAYDASVAGKPKYISKLPRMTDDVEARSDELYRRRIQSLQAVDDGIGKLIDTLRDTGQLDDTYIVFTSDNGFHLGQFRMPAGKQTPYDFDIHVPLVVRGPGIPEGATADQLVGNVDLAPTFAAIAGVTPPAFIDGRSFLPLAKDPTSSRPGRNAFLVEHWRQKGRRPPNGAPLEPPDIDQKAKKARRRKGPVNPIPEYHGVRTRRYLYVEYGTGERELYDVRQDPYELHNIVDTAPPALVYVLSREVAALETCKAAECRTLEDLPIP